MRAIEPDLSAWIARFAVTRPILVSLTALDVQEISLRQSDQTHAVKPLEHNGLHRRRGNLAPIVDN